MSQPWTIDELRGRAATLPRVDLCHLPTPVDELERFAAELGGDVRVLAKRDDLTGPALGGNKLRKLEFSLGRARQQGCDVIVHGLAGQSNYCRQAAAAAAMLGLRCVLVLRNDAKCEDPAQGNRLLDFVFGADVRMVEPALQEQAKAQAVEQLQDQGHKPYLVGRDDEVLGAVAYALALCEIIEQLGDAPDCICVGGNAGTGAGLVLGARLLGLATEVIAYAPSPRDERQVRDDVAGLVNDAARLLGAELNVTAAEIDNTNRHAGEAYAVPTEAGMEALRLLARTQGLLVGPVYTAKALAGMIDDIRRGRIRAGSTAVFLHTGGVPEVFTYHGEIIDHLGEAAAAS